MSAGLPSPAQEGKRVPRLLGWLLISPMLVWMITFIVVPSAILFVYSFCDRDDIGRVVYHFTWSNYTRVADPTYVMIFVRSLWYAGLTTLLCIVIGFPMAYTIARAPEKWRHRFLMAVMVPFWTSFLIRTYAWITILKRDGLLNGFLQYTKMISAPFDMLYNSESVVLGLVYAYLPFMILPVYSSAEKLDESLIEAAHDLGAGPLRVFWEVIIPLTRPGVIAGTLMVFVPAIGMFAISDLMGGAKVPMVGNVIQNQFFQARDWPFGAAFGMVFMGLFGIFYWIQQARQSKYHHD